MLRKFTPRDNLILQLPVQLSDVFTELQRIQTQLNETVFGDYFGKESYCILQHRVYRIMNILEYMREVELAEDLEDEFILWKAK